MNSLRKITKSLKKIVKFINLLKIYTSLYYLSFFSVLIMMFLLSLFIIQFSGFINKLVKFKKIQLKTSRLSELQELHLTATAFQELNRKIQWLMQENLVTFLMSIPLLLTLQLSVFYSLWLWSVKSQLFDFITVLVTSPIYWFYLILLMILNHTFKKSYLQILRVIEN